MENEQIEIFNNLSVREKCSLVHATYLEVEEYKKNNKNIKVSLSSEVGKRLGISPKKAERHHKLYKRFEKNQEWYNYIPTNFDFSIAEKLCVMSNENIKILLDFIDKEKNEKNKIIKIDGVKAIKIIVISQNETLSDYTLNKYINNNENELNKNLLDRIETEIDKLSNDEKIEICQYLFEFLNIFTKENNAKKCVDFLYNIKEKKTYEDLITIGTIKNKEKVRGRIDRKYYTKFSLIGKYDICKCFIEEDENYNVYSEIKAGSKVSILGKKAYFENEDNIWAEIDVKRINKIDDI